MKKYRIFIALFLFAWGTSFAQNDDDMKVHYINVGQGASVLLEFPCGAILIDAGAQDAKYEEKLIDYLDNFFMRRKDLDSTLDLVIVTHAHLDHNLALDDVYENFYIKRYIDNGRKDGSGKANQKWLSENAEDFDIDYANYSFGKITEGGNKEGLTNEIIDPINCKTIKIDPKITILSGRFDKSVGWSATALKNGNNHSVVIKVEYGKSSFLFLGDLEKEGIEKVVEYYKDTDMLNVDVLMVGHHGSYNATTEELLNKVTPDYAVISCGPWNYGKNPGDNKKFNTFNYGHPRINVIDMLSSHITGKRTPKKVRAFSAAKVFKDITISKKIYTTSWDNNIIFSASKDGQYRVTTK